MFQLYNSKLNKKSNRLWQKPHQGSIFYLDEYWYESRHIGHDQINSFMKNLTKDAKLDGTIGYTNHSIRSSCITTLDTSGFGARHITAISSHKNESTIKTYSAKCPENKRKEMYQALNESVVPKKKKKIAETVSKPPKEGNLGTINVQHLQELDMNANNNNANTDPLPANFDLVPFEFDEDDQAIMEYLRKFPEDEAASLPIDEPKKQVTTNNTTMMSSMPVVPKMYFPHSNVTINYNFSK